MEQQVRGTADYHGRTVLLVDDHPRVIEVVAGQLEQRLPGLTVLRAGNGKEALAKLSSRRVDVLVTEIDLQALNGYELIAAARRLFPSLPVVVTTDDCSTAVVRELAALHVDRWMEKPFDGASFTRTIKAELERMNSVTAAA